jgi:hypothetical protein
MTRKAVSLPHEEGHPAVRDGPERLAATTSRPAGYLTAEMIPFEMISRWIWLVPS